MNVAVIPAREGSKRIPQKNVRSFCGRPLISYPIMAALESGVFDEVIVSTDSAEIAAIAKEYGAKVPFMRPKSLADDFTPTADVLMHAFRWYVNNGMNLEYACCIYATAAFAHKRYIHSGLSLIKEKNATSAFAVTSYDFSIFRSLKINEHGSLQMIWPEYEMSRSQDLPESYHDAGQFYWLDVGRFLQAPRIYTPDAAPVILPRYLVQDIDTLEDWKRAELMYRACREEGLL